MFKTKTLLSVLAFAAMTGQALAQTTEAPADQTAPAAQEEAPANSAENGLDTGTPDGGGEPQVGQVYRRDTAGDWELQCVKQEDQATEPCQLYQLLRGAENNPVAEVIIEKLPEGGKVAAGATVIVPLGTALSADLRISVDAAQGKVYRYAFCDGNACYARIGLLPADISAFKAGNTANLTIVPYQNQDTPVTLKLSLAGFTSSYDGILPAKAPAQ